MTRQFGLVSYVSDVPIILYIIHAYLYTIPETNS